MESSYLPWPAEKNELIKINLYNDYYPVNSHRHDFVEIVFVAQGSCIHCYHESEMMLIHGDTFIVLPHEEHEYKINSKTLIYNCLFYPEVLGEDWNVIKGISGINNLLMIEPFFRLEQKRQEILHLNPSKVEVVESILKRMIEEQDNKKSGYQLVQKANLTILLSTLGRCWEDQFKDTEDIYTEKRNMLAQALNYIEENFNSELRVQELACRVYLSPDYFRKLFKEVTGLSPIEYINKVRLSKALKILEDNSICISEAAEMVGINDINYFSRLFKANFGCSPTEFRKKKK
jgi:AraC-like DNA-binding protein